jgi:hypothetical protein
VTDDEIVAQALATADERAAGPVSEEGCAAYVRAYAIRQLPVDVAARILRQEILEAFRGPLPHSTSAWSAQGFWLRFYARLAGITLHVVPVESELRARAEIYAKRRGRP